MNFLAYLRSGTALPFLTFVLFVIILFVIRNLLLHLKVHFEKKVQYRVDKPDYSERAVTEALVNALIHRDYLVMGSEVHIDMYDDRLEIYSPVVCIVESRFKSAAWMKLIPCAVIL